MIRNIHNLACTLLGVVFIIAIVTYKEDWAIVPLVAMVPWDKVFSFADRTLHEYYMDKQAKASGKYLGLDTGEETTRTYDH